MDLSRVEFRWASEEMAKAPLEYWGRVIDIAREFNLPRVIRYTMLAVVVFR